jgi:ubiquinone/menaquinone biosynthesis C-methylase UbiE
MIFMKSYRETKENYDRGVDWHAKKSISYDWKRQIALFLKGNGMKLVLDAGCGCGRDVPIFIKKKCSVVGLDYSKETIRHCKRDFPDTPFFVGDIRKLSFKAGMFDGVWACASLLNISKKEVSKVLSEFRRVLKPGGRLFVSVKEGTGERMVSDEAGARFFSFFTRTELRTLVKQAGFVVQQVELVPDAQLTGVKEHPPKPSWICIYAVKAKI